MTLLLLVLNCVFLGLKVSLDDQLVKSPVDFDPRHHPVEGCFQSGGSGPRRVLLYPRTTGQKQLLFLPFNLISLGGTLFFKDFMTLLIPFSFYYLYVRVFVSFFLASFFPSILSRSCKNSLDKILFL